VTWGVSVGAAAAGIDAAAEYAELTDTKRCRPLLCSRCKFLAA